MRISYHVVSAPSPLGLLFLASTEKGVCRLEFMDRRSLKRTLQTRAADHPGAEWTHSVSDLRPLAERLDDYFSGVREGLDWPLDPSGDALQQRVWSVLRAVPFGRTCTLAQLCEAAGQPQGSRAVAAAVQRNPVALAIPCHRVVGADGRPTAYVGGLPRKKWLLALEGRFHALPNMEDNRVIAEARVVLQRPAGPVRRKVARARTKTAKPAINPARPGTRAPAAARAAKPASAPKAARPARPRTPALAAKPARGKR